MKLACVMRDEIASWKSPLDEWFELQKPKKLVPKVELKSVNRAAEDRAVPPYGPSRGPWDATVADQKRQAERYLAEVARRKQLLDTSKASMHLHSGLDESDFEGVSSYDSNLVELDNGGVPRTRIAGTQTPFSLSVQPGDGPLRVGKVLQRGNGQYQVVATYMGDMSRVLVMQVG